MKETIAKLCLGPDRTIRDAITAIDQGAKGIVLITDDRHHLLGTITDGDVRRAMIDHVDLDGSVQQLLKRKSPRYAVPATAPLGTEPAALLHLMHEQSVHQIPLLAPDSSVADLVTMDDLLPDTDVPLQAVIMAGGFGKRMRPFTDELPKPMLPVGDRPLLERTIEQLRSAGIRRVGVTTHYLPEKITTHFGDGAAFGVDLHYLSENEPLGTAGALGLMEKPAGPLLVINGDILTSVNYRAMLADHRESASSLTVAVRQFSMQVPYGVVEGEAGKVTGVREKPELRFLVNAGIYLLDPAVFEFLEAGQRCDMPDLIHRLLQAGRSVNSFLIHEYWLDIGKHDDYLRAQEAVKDGTFTP